VLYKIRKTLDQSETDRLTSEEDEEETGTVEDDEEEEDAEAQQPLRHVGYRPVHCSVGATTLPHRRIILESKATCRLYRKHSDIGLQGNSLVSLPMSLHFYQMSLHFYQMSLHFPYVSHHFSIVRNSDLLTPGKQSQNVSHSNKLLPLEFAFC
jgi:hypothetical protein